MTKQKVIDSKNEERLNLIITISMFVCLIGQIIALYFNINIVFEIFVYLFALFIGMRIGMLCTYWVIQ